MSLRAVAAAILLGASTGPACTSPPKAGHYGGRSVIAGPAKAGHYGGRFVIAGPAEDGHYGGLFATGSASAGHGVQAESIKTRVLVEKVACANDATQTYTLYLPAPYTPQRRWPVLFVFDPRGRGTMAAQIFKDAAERFAWIIASSDNTRSDGPLEPNRRAVAAMWPDVLTRYSVDARRIYIAGFSGGAGVATVVATSTGHVSGIIAAGAPDPGESEKAPPVAWFGAAGRLDFNFLDAKSTDERMLRAGNPRRLEYFDGAHQWIPNAMAMRAAGWKRWR